MSHARLLKNRSIGNRLMLPTFIAVCLLLFGALDAYACPGCKQALATADGEQSNMVTGYFWSILFMLSMPFTLLGFFSGSMYLAVRKARHAEPAPHASHPA